MDQRRLPLLGAIAGTLVGAAIVVALVATGVLERSEVVTGEAAERALIESWERSRTASYAMEGQFERVKPGAGVLESSVFEAQRPPDRLRRGFGGVDGTLEGRTIVCATSPDGRYRCAPNGPAADHDADVAREVERLTDYVTSDPPLYEVASDGDECFLLQQRVAAPDPPYGRLARMCFDGGSGALRFLQVESASGTDTFRATSIRAVTDADFALEPDPSYAVRTVPETTTTTTGDPDEPDGEEAEDLGALTDDELFARCEEDGGDRALHDEMWRRAISINDQRWLGESGPASACLLRGALYYLEQIGEP